MLTLLSTLISFLMGGLPKVLDFFQDRSDKKHELALAQMQTERELALRNAGFEAQAKVEQIHTEQMQINADMQTQQAQLQERQALYAHDIAISQGASTWVIDMRASVRPVITYGFFFLLVFVDVFGFYYAIKTGVAFNDALNALWDDDTQQIFASIIAFWFGSQAFAKK